MITIDGSYLEGGGQIVRTAVSLSAITKKPVKIINIRKNRKNSGLSNQHIACVNAISKICNAKVEGLLKSSETLVFYPGDIISENFEIDIKTAGSISLVIQSLLPIALAIDKNIEITLIGGTNVEFSPPIDYIKNVTLKFLENIGINSEINIIERGFFPEGGGTVKITIKPSKIIPFELIENKSIELKGIIFNQNLDENISKRIRKSASDILLNKGFCPEIKLEKTNGKSTGVGIFLFTNYIGSDCLGKRGIPSEKVGKIASENLIEELDTKMAIDSHLADQIIPFMPFSDIKVGVSKITNHTSTNIYVVEKFFDVKFNIDEYSKDNAKGYVISTKGV
ncbi:RNA 3'-terminal phosphate cyclase [Methanococcus maripaludis]|uniref:RNA 3'-terminal phosphate cyclase n=2 Tax=Methanococcus maripaludis TaxID=39152 RepID=A0A7J9PIZ2_METMI|nr:RNA 3'-terminal phosphate cyclase (ATP) [Methanococcus maripaludis]